jgi:hypothetical protein
MVDPDESPSDAFGKLAKSFYETFGDGLRPCACLFCVYRLAGLDSMG